MIQSTKFGGTGNDNGIAVNISASSNSTITTLSVLSLPGAQVTGSVPSATLAGNITATSNSTITTLSALSLPYSQLTGAPTALVFSDSLVNTSGTVTLKNDSASPAASQYYGTNASSVLGYFALPSGTGTVTSVAMTVPSFLSISGSPITTSGTLGLTLSGTALPVANGGTGLTSGTSGGILGFTATGTIASSALLTLHGLMIGGGAGATPTSLAVGATGTILTGVSANNPAFSATPTLGASGTLGTLGLAGNTSGVISIKPQAAAGTYNFNLPITAGSAGQVLTSQGGGASVMTWTTPGTGTVTSFSFTNGGGFTGSVATSTTTPALSLTGTLTGDITGSLTATVLSATTNSTITTLSALSLPYSQLTGAPAAGASTDLSNLTPTSINQSLVPSADLTDNLGSTINRWSTLYVGNIDDAGGFDRFDITTANTVIQPGSGGITMINSVARIGTISSTPQHQLWTTTTTGANVGTLTNVPVSGNPAGYIQITINGVQHYIPYW